MAKRTAQKQKAVGFTAANERTPKAFEVSRVTTFERPDLLILLGLAIVTFGIYAQLIGHHFITFDDPTYIQENPMVNRGVTLAGLAWAFTTFHAGNWHPLTWIAHMIDSQLFGTFAGGHLLVNALIHTANTLLLFWFLLRTTHARWSSALVAALFALHPLHVESVAWAAERKDTLSTFFGLLSLIAYMRYAEAPSIRRYAWVAIMLALGLLAKPMLVTWPFVMLLLDYWPLRRFQRSEVSGQWSVVRSLVVEKIPLFAIVAASAVITTIAQSHGGGVRTFTEFPIALRLSNALVSYAKYLLLAFWPNDLAVYYPYTGADTPAWQIIGAALLLIAITVFCFFQRKIRPYLLTGWCWFLGTLVPVIGLVQVGLQAMADRYTYVPFIGLFVMVAWAIGDLAPQWRFRAPAFGLFAIAALLACLALTRLQLPYWKNSETLFSHTLQVSPDNSVAHHNLGAFYVEQGNLGPGIEHLSKALQNGDSLGGTHYDLGLALMGKGRIQEAVEHFREAVGIEPDNYQFQTQLCRGLLSQGKFEEAESAL